MRTIVVSIVGMIAVWLRQAGVIDIDDQTAEAAAVTILLVVAIFQRLGTLKAESAAIDANESAEVAAEEAARAVDATRETTVAVDAAARAAVAAAEKAEKRL